MSTVTVVASALDEYRQMLQVDGADLELMGVTDGVVELKLLFGPETCEECVLSKDMLETILLDGLQKQDRSIAQVVVEDPRGA